MAGKLAQGQAVCEEAIEAAERRGDRRIRAHALVVLLEWQSVTGQAGEADRAQRVAEDARAVFEEAGDELGLARAWSLFGQADFARDQMNRAHAAYKRALEHAQRAQHERLQARVLDWANAALLWGPATSTRSPGKASKRSIGPAPMATGTSRRTYLATHSVSAMQCGDALTGPRQIVEAKAILEDLGLLLWRGHVSFSAGYVELLAGDPSAAEREWRQGYELLEATGERYIQTLNAACIALALCLQTRWSEADHWATVSEELAPADAANLQGWWRAARTTVLATRGTGRKCAGSPGRQWQRFATGLVTSCGHLRDPRRGAARGRRHRRCARARARGATHLRQKGHVVGAANARALLG